MIYDLHGTELNFIHKRLLRAGAGFLAGGPAGAAAGFITGGSTRGKSTIRPPIAITTRRGGGGGGGGVGYPFNASVSQLFTDVVTGGNPTDSEASKHQQRTQAAGELRRRGIDPNTDPRARQLAGCGVGYVMENGRCVRRGRSVFDPLGIFGPSAGGGTAAAAPTGEAVQGAFGMPALVPFQETRVQLQCPRGFVLGTDNLCYPKVVLSRRNKFRKWRGAARAPVTAADARAIRRAGRTKDRVLALAKDVGLHASKTKPASRARLPKHQHLLLKSGD